MKALIRVGLLSSLYIGRLAATHLMGGEITYDCIGPNQYRITVKLYRDCGGIQLEDPITLSYASSACGVNSSISLPRISVQDVTPLCPGGQSRCGGSGPYGWEEHVYQGVINLPPGCSDWVLWYSNCCRNSSITTGPADDYFTIYSYLNNTLAPCNNSPRFNSPPTALACLGQRNCINPGVTDPDGDSLVFSLTYCRAADYNSSVGYSGGYSGTNPLPGSVTVDSRTGTVCFTPTALAVGVVCIRVDEYRNGVKIGEYLRDMQIRVVSCANQLPVASGIDGVPYNPNDPATYTVEVCATGAQACFNINFSDPDGQPLTVSWNNGIPGASFVVNNNGTPNPTATFCWTPTPADIGQHQFVVTVMDNACPIRGVSSYGYAVNVIGGVAHPVDAGPDATICQGQSVTLNGSVGGPPGDIASIQWIPATGLSNPNILNPVASPTSTTTYTLQVTFVGGCRRTDQVTVTVLPLPAPPTVTPLNPQICSGSSVMLTASSPGAIDYEWREGSATGPIVGTGVNFTASPATTTTYYVFAVGANGCRSAPTPVTVSVNPPPPPVSCVVIYVTPGGCNNPNDPNCGTRANPANLLTAIAKAQCNNSYLKLACGTYNIDNPISFTSNTTVEGGYEPGTWVKTNGCQSIIYRTAANVQPNPNRLIAVELNSVRYLQMYDVTIQTANAPNPPIAGDFRGVSTYAVWMANCSDYKFVRCRFEAGAASNGGAGANGAGFRPDGSPGSGGAGGTGSTTRCGGCGAAGAPGGAATTGAAGGVGGGGCCGSGCNIFGCNASGCTGCFGSNGQNGADGTDATTPAPIPTPGVYFSPVQSPSGTPGGHGGGGGGGGGGDIGTCCFSTCHSGGTCGGRGGDGGRGGNPGQGGWGGGGAFGVYLYQNGANGSFVDCGFNTLGAGSGGAGGIGANGQPGGAPGARCVHGCAGTPCTQGCCGGDCGAGGEGGWGGAGGRGGNGAAGHAGIAHRIYIVSGSLPSLVQGGTPVALALGGNNPPAYNFAAEPTIRVNGFACTNKDYTIEITSGGFNQWVSLGPGATATVPNTNNPLTYQYTSVGRKTIVVRVGGVDYIFTEFIGILLPDNQVPTLTVNPAGPICQGGTASFSGDLTGVSYEWQLIPPSGPTVNGPNAQIWSNLALTQAGTYTIRHRVYTDCCGWTPWVSTTMVVHPQATVTVTPPAPQICYGDQVTLTATVGPAGSTVLWSPALGLDNTVGTTVVASPTTTTTYTVLVIPPVGSCVATENVMVTVNPLPDATAAVTPASCGNNASVTLTITAGAPPVSVVWNTTPPQTGLTANNLQAGIYTATLTDANGCTKETSVFVPTPPGALMAWLQNSQPPACFGQNNGTATIGVIGGTPPYSYSWSHNPTLNAPTATGLVAGNYTVTVQDNAGCSFVVSFALSQPAPLTIALDSLRQNEPVSCSGACNGVLTVEASGGTLPYTYTWSSSTDPAFSFSGVNAAGTQVSGLCEGEYTVTVTDANGCTASITVQLGVTPLTYTLSKTDALCFGAPQGSASVTIQTAHSGTTWQWTGPGGYTSAPNETNITNLIPGRYYIHFTIPGCPGTIIDSVDIDSPPDITITPSHNMPLCQGAANGSITIMAGGGVGGYSYNLNGSPWGPNNTFSGLASGTYTLGVQDANGCTKYLTYFLPEPTALSITVTAASNVSCNGGSDGSVTVGASGGTSGYQYSLNGGAWVGGPGGTHTFTGLSAGTYTIGVRDANGCQASVNVTVGEPAVLGVSVSSVVDVSCNGGSDGSVTVGASGGTSGYQYSLNGGAWVGGPGGTHTFTGLSAGTYTIGVRDANGCQASVNVTVGEPAVLGVSVSSVVDVSCNGGSDGSVTVGASGGTSGYQYSLNGGAWVGGPGGTHTFTGLSAGTYTIGVRDANGCQASVNVTVGEPAVLGVSVSSVVDVSCNGGSDGSVTVGASGGTSGYQYSLNGGAWVGGPGGTHTFTGLSAGTYTIGVRDANGCQASVNVTVGEPAVLGVSVSSVVDVSCNGGSDGSVTVGASGGTSGYQYSLNGGAWVGGPGGTHTFTGLSAGTYTIGVRDANGCQASTTVTVTEPPVLTLSVTTSNALCAGTATGSIVFTANGGTPPYQYSIDGGVSYGSTSTWSVGAGTYTLYVRDANGCVAGPQTVTISEPTPLALQAVVTDAVCRESSDGGAQVSASGGTPPYTYTWSGGGLSGPVGGPVLTNAPAGTYAVVVEDANGCRDTLRVDIGYRSYVDVVIRPDSVVGCVPLGVRWEGVVSGVGPFVRYDWSLGDGNSASTPVVDWVYTVEGQYVVRLIVRNADGCSDTAYAVAQAHFTPVPGYVVEPDIQQDLVVGTVITLTSTTQGATSTQWYIPGYGSQSGPVWQVSFVEPGEYCFTLVVDRGGCADSLKRCIVVKDPYVYLPNAFTPNGDGVNDVFEVKAFGLKEPRLRIYDRWGLLVFDNGGDMSRYWDGTYKGQPVPEDAYTVILEGKLPPYDKPFKRYGTVTVIR